VETGEGVVRTYFLKPESSGEIPEPSAAGIFEVSLDTLEQEKARFRRYRDIDVRDLEMPLPMLTILSALEELPEGEALYVHHKKVPQYLLPELAERHFKVFISDIADGNVKMLIHR
jgi:TusA-related sulfurtransferase